MIFILLSLKRFNLPNQSKFTDMSNPIMSQITKLNDLLRNMHLSFEFIDAVLISETRT